MAYDTDIQHIVEWTLSFELYVRNWPVE